jgi:hypothetical protein
VNREPTSQVSRSTLAAVSELVPECADFCRLPEPQTGRRIDDHGELCISDPCGREIQVDSDRGLLELTVDLAASFRHNDTDDGLADANRGRIVRLVADPTNASNERCVAAFLSTGSARCLAAALTRAADLADQLI